MKSIQNMEQARGILKELGTDQAGIDIMSRKMILRVIAVRDLDIRAANILKQEALSRGAELALPKDACKLVAKKIDGILIANLKQLAQIIGNLSVQPFGLPKVGLELERFLNDSKAVKPKYMGILNVTPDSFSDGGRYVNIDDALNHALKLIKDGAHIIDIGGESTGPDSKHVSAKEELSRVLPVIGVLKDRKITISIDTWKSEVAEKAVKAGASMINDVTAFRGDSRMVKVVAKTGVLICLMYSKDSTPRTTRKNIKYNDVVDHILEFLYERTEFAIRNGVKREQIIVDPGMGTFVSADPKYSFEILARLREFKVLGYPVLIGASRKSFIGGELSERDFGTYVANQIAIQNGADIIRTHKIC